MLRKALKLNSFDLKEISKNRKITSYKVIRSDFLDIKKVTWKESIKFKATVIVSSKQVKKAVARNKMKRRFFTILERYLKENVDLYKQNISLLLYPKKNTEKIKFRELQITVYNELNKLLK